MHPERPSGNDGLGVAALVLPSCFTDADQNSRTARRLPSYIHANATRIASSTGADVNQAKLLVVVVTPSYLHQRWDSWVRKRGANDKNSNTNDNEVTVSVIIPVKTVKLYS